MWTCPSCGKRIWAVGQLGWKTKCPSCDAPLKLSKAPVIWRLMTFAPVIGGLVLSYLERFGIIEQILAPVHVTTLVAISVFGVLMLMRTTRLERAE
jgi:hypothetical protein